MRDFNSISKEAIKKYPDPHAYKSVWEKALWTLEVVANELGLERLTCSEIAQFLTDVVEIDTSQQAVHMAMRRLKRGFVNKKGSTYKLMEKGRKTIVKTQLKNEIHIQPGKPYSSKNILTKEVLSTIKGDLRICDPYVGARVLDLLVSLSKSHKIRILTCNIEDKPKGVFQRALKDLIDEGYDIEVRIYQKSELHDRYLIDDHNLWVVGHSIKDIGGKECFVYCGGPDLRSSSLEMYNRRWKVSKVYSA
ncbi:hypothetical protein ACFL96_09280 [Thermoproteota archaeon]